MRQRITLPGGIDVRQQAGPTRSRPRDRSPADGHRADQGLERPGRCGSDHVDVRQRVPLHTHVVEREDDPVLTELRDLTRSLGLAEPDAHFEIVNDSTGELLAVADLAWENAA